MTIEQKLKAIALFFYCVFLDESKARAASASALRSCEAKLSGRSYEEDESPQVLIHCVLKQYQKYSKKYFASQRPSDKPFQVGWMLPENLEVSIWRDFQKVAPPDEFVAVVWSQVIGFSDEEIAKGLGVTTGTVRHRVGRGLRRLSELM